MSRPTVDIFSFTPATVAVAANLSVLHSPDAILKAMDAIQQANPNLDIAEGAVKKRMARRRVLPKQISDLELQCLAKGKMKSDLDALATVDGQLIEVYRAKQIFEEVEASLAFRPRKKRKIAVVIDESEASDDDDAAAAPPAAAPSPGAPAPPAISAPR